MGTVIVFCMREIIINSFNISRKTDKMKSISLLILICCTIHCTESFLGAGTGGERQFRRPSGKREVPNVDETLKFCRDAQQLCYSIEQYEKTNIKKESDLLDFFYREE